MDDLSHLVQGHGALVFWAVTSLVGWLAGRLLWRRWRVPSAPSELYQRLLAVLHDGQPWIVENRIMGRRDAGVWFHWKRWVDYDERYRAASLQVASPAAMPDGSGAIDVQPLLTGCERRVLWRVARRVHRRERQREAAQVAQRLRDMADAYRVAATTRLYHYFAKAVAGDED